MVIPAKQEALDKFTRKVEELYKIVRNRKHITDILGMYPPNLYSALEGNFGIDTYHNYCDIIDEYTREKIMKGGEKILRIKKF